MTRRRRKAAGSIAWPDHPLAVSGSEILATRILPLMGHNARDFARAAAVCRGWRAACRAAAATLSVYRETALHLPGEELNINLKWSPCGKFVAATVCHPPRLLIWRASTGALVNEWALATPATAVAPEFLGDVGFIPVVFSRDSTRVLTLIGATNHFAIWSVPDGQLLAVNSGDINGIRYSRADFGVPGSASDGLVGFGSDDGIIHLWDVSPPPEGGGLRSRVDLAPGEDSLIISLSFSPDGSKFAAAGRGIAYVYDVASLTRLGAYDSPSRRTWAAWAPGGNVLVAWDKRACVWDFSRPEAPYVVTANVGPGGNVRSWSPSGASYFVVRKLVKNGFALEERRSADGSLVRAVNVGRAGKKFPRVRMSPDAHAVLVDRYEGVPALHVFLFE